MKFVLKTSIVVVFVILDLTITFGQNSVRELENYFAELRTNPSAPMPRALLIDTKNDEKLLVALNRFSSDSLVKLRARAFDIISQIADRNSSPEIQKQCLQIYMKALDDTDSGISGDVLNRLSEFSKEFFTPSNHDKIKTRLRVTTMHLDRLIKLAGYVGVNCHSELRQILSTAKNSKVQWACELALARLSDEASINNIIQKLDRRIVDDRYVYTVLPQLVYTRQRALLKYVIEVMQSDELNCLSSNADSEKKIKCSYRALEYLAPVIRNFPIKVDDEGMLEVTDYEASLAVAREWLVAHEDYAIDDFRF